MDGAAVQEPNGEALLQACIQPVGGGRSDPNGVPGLGTLAAAAAAARALLMRLGPIDAPLHPAFNFVPALLEHDGLFVEPVDTR